MRKIQGSIESQIELIEDFKNPLKNNPLDI